MRQFLTNEKGERTAVLLPIAEYEELLELAELAEDAEALRKADEVLAAIERGEEDVLPLDQAVKEMEEERERLRGNPAGGSSAVEG